MHSYFIIIIGRIDQYIFVYSYSLIRCFRYGEANSLTFALPKQPGAHVFNYNLKFNNDLVRPSPSGSYNILCNHLHFDEKGVKETMPQGTG